MGSTIVAAESGTVIACYNGCPHNWGKNGSCGCGGGFGNYVFIDHGNGVVIGETAEVGEGTVLYQGCTLGGTGKQTGKRHPTIGKNCVISAGAKILGDITVGDCAKVGAGAVVLRNVPAHATVVGVPAKVVRIGGSRDGVDLYQEKEDPVLKEVCALRERVFALEEQLQKLTDKEVDYENLQHADKD